MIAKPKMLCLTSTDGAEYDLHFLVPEHMTPEEVSACAEELIERYNAEDRESEDGCCENGESVGDNIISDLQKKGFIHFSEEENNLVVCGNWD